MKFLENIKSMVNKEMIKLSKNEQKKLAELEINFAYDMKEMNNALNKEVLDIDKLLKEINISVKCIKDKTLTNEEELKELEDDIKDEKTELEVLKERVRKEEERIEELKNKVNKKATNKKELQVKLDESISKLDEAKTKIKEFNEFYTEYEDKKNNFLGSNLERKAYENYL